MSVSSHSGTPADPDVIIVGAGSAGCVLAERLSRDPNRSVLLLEAGPADLPSSVTQLDRLPVGSGSTRVRHHHAIGGPGVVRGHGVGGSSSVNGAYFLRWHPEDFATWPPGWTVEAVEQAYRRLDGPDGAMSVSAVADTELPPTAVAFERHWGSRVSTRPVADSWPIIGLNRVRMNHSDGHRVSAASAFLFSALSRPNLELVGDTSVQALIVKNGVVVGVETGDRQWRAPEVILCAGTLGSAELIFRSGLGGTVFGRADEAEFVEHREVLVRYRLVEPAVPTLVLPSVVHTSNGFEIRCYGGDFADFIEGVLPTAPAVGIAAMQPGVPGRLRWSQDRLTVDLGVVDVGEVQGWQEVVAEVVDMLEGPSFDGLVAPGSVSLDPVIATSQHAMSSLPMGRRTDSLGAVDSVPGLRVVDGSILPTSGRSGPHATIMMMASHIAEALAHPRRIATYDQNREAESRDSGRT